MITLLDMQYQLTRIDSQLELELTLIHHRVQWLLTTQIFLFGGYFFQPPIEALAESLPRILLLVGLISSISIFASLIIAFHSAWRLRPIRYDLEEQLIAAGYQNLTHNKPNNTINIIGAVPPLVIAFSIFMAWLFIGVTAPVYAR